jgi:lipoprotein-anchoring transpeptidase ErfK/SrfK
MRQRCIRVVALIAGLALAPPAARATPPPRVAPPPFDNVLPVWRDGDVPELPAGTASIAVKLQDTPVYQFAGDARARRGLVTLGARLQVYALREASACGGPWLMVGAAAWICADKVSFEADEPIADLPLLAHADGLPYPYYFVGVEGAYSYADLAGAGNDAPAQALERGWAVPIVEQRTKDRQLWGRTRRNKWIAMSDLALAQSLNFQGAQLIGDLADEVAAAVPLATPPGHAAPNLAPRPLKVGWVMQDHAAEFGHVNGGGTRVALQKFQQLTVWQERRGAIGMVCRTSADGVAERWVRCQDILRPTVAAPPVELGAGAATQKWLDVELATQSLVAYVGAHPVFATLVSTGKGAPGSDTGTPRGVHRIWVKIAAQTMDNMENVDAEHHYSIEDVPWVQFFNKGVALHAAFWHKNFGRVQSHGCVNLAPIDAKFLFDWTAPHLPAGYSAVYPTTFDAGTVVRVR